MTAATLIGLASAALVGLGLYGVITNPQPLRKILAFNLVGSGVSCCLASSRAEARRRGSAAIRCRRRWSSLGSSSPFPQPRWRLRCCCGCSRQPARPHCAPTRRRARGRSHRRLMADSATALLGVTTTGGFLLVLSLVVPVAGVLLAFAAGGRHVERIAPVIMALGFVIAGVIAVAILQTGGPLVSARRVGAAAGCGAARGRVLGGHDGDHGDRDLRHRSLCAPGFPHASRVGRGPRAVRVLDLAPGGLGSAEHGIPGGRSLHIVRCAGAADVCRGAAGCLDGRPETLAAALRYLVCSAWLGPLSGRYSAALRAYGTLDIVLLSQRVRVEPAPLVAAALMTVGLLAKTALFPLHLWLPPPMPALPPPPARCCRRWW